MSKLLTRSLIINIIITTIILIILISGLIWIDRSYTKLIDEETKKLNNVSDLIILVNNEQIYALNYNNIDSNHFNGYEQLIHQTNTIILNINKDIKNPTEKRLINIVIKSYSIYQNIVQNIIQNKNLTQIAESENAYRKVVEVSDNLSYYYIKEIDKNNQINTKRSNIISIICLTALVLNQLLLLSMLIYKKKESSGENKAGG